MLREKLVIFTLTIPKKKFESFLLTFCLTQLLIRIKLTRGDNGVYFSHDVKNIVPNLLVFSHISVKIYILSSTYYTDWKECYSYFFFTLFSHEKETDAIGQPSSWVMEIILVSQFFFQSHWRFAGEEKTTSNCSGRKTETRRSVKIVQTTRRRIHS